MVNPLPSKEHRSLPLICLVYMEAGGFQRTPRHTSLESTALERSWMLRTDLGFPLQGSHCLSLSPKHSPHPHPIFYSCLRDSPPSPNLLTSSSFLSQSPEDFSRGRASSSSTIIPPSASFGPTASVPPLPKASVPGFPPLSPACQIALSLNPKLNHFAHLVLSTSPSPGGFPRMGPKQAHPTLSPAPSPLRDPPWPSGPGLSLLAYFLCTRVPSPES